MKTTRKPISKKTRFEVFKRDGFSCQYCGATPPKVVLQVDHIVAVAAGGSNNIDNFVTSCQPCNIGKGAHSLKTAPKSLSDKAADTAEREAQLLGYQAIMQGRRDRVEKETWVVLKLFHGNACKSVPTNQFLSVKLFVERIGLDSVIYAAEKAILKNSRDPFRYFCGICWSMSKELQA